MTSHQDEAPSLPIVIHFTDDTFEVRKENKPTPVKKRNYALSALASLFGSSIGGEEKTSSSGSSNARSTPPRKGPIEGYHELEGDELRFPEVAEKDAFGVSSRDEEDDDVETKWDHDDDENGHDYVDLSKVTLGGRSIKLALDEEEEGTRSESRNVSEGIPVNSRPVVEAKLTENIVENALNDEEDDSSSMASSKWRLELSSRPLGSDLDIEHLIILEPGQVETVLKKLLGLTKLDFHLQTYQKVTNSSASSGPNYAIHLGSDSFQSGESNLRKWTDAVVLVESLNHVHDCDSMPVHAAWLLKRQPFRTSVITILCNAEYIRFARTTFSSKYLTGMQTSLTNAFPMVISTEGCSHISPQALRGMIQILVEARDTCTKSRLRAIDYSFLNLLGTGSTSVVFEAMKLATGEVCCVKIVKQSHESSFLNELKALEALKGVGNKALPALVHKDLSLRMIVFSNIGQSLNKLTWGSIRSGSHFQSIAKAMQLVHQLGFVHRDVSPGNLVLNQDTSLGLIDFGTSISFSDEACLYSGSKFFAADGICQLLGSDWTARKVRFQHVDDLESLMKTVLWSLDLDCYNTISYAITQTKVTPQEVLLTWNQIWKSQLGKRFRKEIVYMRSHPEEAHKYVFNWLGKIGWSQTWSIL